MLEFEDFFSRITCHQKSQAIDKKSGLSEAGTKVYVNSYLFGHIEKIETVYLSLEHYLGKKNLSFFAFQYLKSHPPGHENIDQFGDQFPSFLKMRPELSGRPEVYWLGVLDWYFYWQSPDDEPSMLPGGMIEYWQFHRGLRSDFPIVSFERNFE